MDKVADRFESICKKMEDRFDKWLAAFEDRPISMGLKLVLAVLLLRWLWRQVK